MQSFVSKVTKKVVLIFIKVFFNMATGLCIFVADNTAVAAVNLLPKQKCHRYLAIIFRFFMFYFTVLCKLFVLLCYICALESNDVSKVSP